MGLSDMIGGFSRDELRRGRPDKLNLALNKAILSGQVGDTEEREPGFHVSQMCFFCPRRFIFDLVFPEGRVSAKPDPATQRIFDAGHAYHDWYQNRYLGPARILKGRWKCLGCSRVVRGFMPRKCKACGKGRAYIRYQEPKVRDESLAVTIGGKRLCLVGHADGIIQFSKDEEEEVLELKTMEPEKWTALQEPLFWNVHQVQIYTHLLKLKRARLVYINKSTNLTKEFPLVYDPGPWHDVESKIGSLQRFFRKVDENGGVINPEWIYEVRGPCKSPEQYTAARCTQVGPCFTRPREVTGGLVMST